MAFQKKTMSILSICVAAVSLGTKTNALALHIGVSEKSGVKQSERQSQRQIPPNVIQVADQELRSELGSSFGSIGAEFSALAATIGGSSSLPPLAVSSSDESRYATGEASAKAEAEAMESSDLRFGQASGNNAMCSAVTNGGSIYLPIYSNPEIGDSNAIIYAVKPSDWAERNVQPTEVDQAWEGTTRCGGANTGTSGCYLKLIYQSIHPLDAWWANAYTSGSQPADNVIESWLALAGKSNSGTATTYGTFYGLTTKAANLGSWQDHDGYGRFARCESWCCSSSHPWSNKCNFWGCNGCPECWADNGGSIETLYRPYSCANNLNNGGGVFGSLCRDATCPAIDGEPLVANCDV